LSESGRPPTTITANPGVTPCLCCSAATSTRTLSNTLSAISTPFTLMAVVWVANVLLEKLGKRCLHVLSPDRQPIEMIGFDVTAKLR
jgi:hypothetical protein